MRSKAYFAPAIAALALTTACSDQNSGEPAATEAAVEPAGDDLGPPPPPEDQSATSVDEASPNDVATDPTPVIEGITNKRLTFDKGASSTRVTGSIKGYETVDYLLNVREGQSLNVSMATRNTATYFNILEPGETDLAIYNGSINGNMYEGVTTESGDYRIRIYMMRSAARREETAEYALEAAVD